MASHAELRHRLPQDPSVLVQAEPVDAARGVVREPNNVEENTSRDETKKRTYGRTPDGTGME